MNMRYASAYVISRVNIEQFLQLLGAQFQQPSNLYLTGNAVPVHLGLRAGTTNILQLVVETDDEARMSAVISRCAEAVHLNVEFASPEDLLPIPWTWQDTSQYIGPYGYIDAFYFDFVSLALGKIAQGGEADLQDAWLLVQHKVVSLHELDNAYLDIQPRMGKKPYDHIQPQQFATYYARVRKWLQRNTSS
jgi:hypothetical protein